MEHLISEYKRISASFHEHKDVARYTAEFALVAHAAEISVAELSAVINSWIEAGQPDTEQPEKTE